MTLYRLPWQHTSSTKRPSKFQFLKTIWKTKSVTYRFYFFVGNLPEFFNFLASMTKSYLVEFKIHRKRAFYSLQNIVLDNFPLNFFILSAIVNDTCMQKIKIGHRAKFWDKDKFFSAGFISGSRDFTPYFHIRCVGRATFDRNLIQSAFRASLKLKMILWSKDKRGTLTPSMEQGHYHLWTLENKNGFPISKEKEQSKKMQQQEATMWLLRKERSDEINLVPRVS